MGARDIQLQQIIKCVETAYTRLRLILLQTIIIIITFVFAKVSQPARIKQEKCQTVKNGEKTNCCFPCLHIINHRPLKRGPKNANIRLIHNTFSPKSKMSVF